MSERGEHRAIYSVLLQSPEFLELSPDGQLVWFHLKLMLGPAGIDVIPAAEAQLEETTGMGSERVRDGISDAIEVGLLRRERNVLWIPNGLRFEPSRSLENENHVKSIVRHIGGLPKLAIVNDFAEYYGLEPPFPELCPTGSPSDGIPDHGERRTENGERKTENSHTARDDLAEWLNGHSGSLPDGPPLNDPQTRQTLYQHYGPPSMRGSAWKRRDGTSVPTEDRPRIFALAISGYVGLEGKTKIVSSEFDGMLRKVARAEAENESKTEGRGWLYDDEEDSAA